MFYHSDLTQARSLIIHVKTGVQFEYELTLFDYVIVQNYFEKGFSFEVGYFCIA